MPSRAEYFRDYRARKKARPVENAVTDGRMLGWDCPNCGQHVTSMIVLNDENRARIAELEEEIRHLKAELAKRAAAIEALPEPTLGLKGGVNRADAVAIARGGFNTRPF